MRLRNLLPLLALVAAPAFAQDAHFGLQGGISLPQGDVKDAVDSKMGFGIGVHVAIDFKGGHVLRPRLDYTTTKGTMSELASASTIRLPPPPSVPTTTTTCPARPPRAST